MLYEDPSQKNTKLEFTMTLLSSASMLIIMLLGSKLATLANQFIKTYVEKQLSRPLRRTYIWHEALSSKIEKTRVP
jgi:hypothetical protein